MAATLYHGTNTLSWQRARAAGALGPKFDPEQLAHEIEQEHGLAHDSVWRHPVNEFSHTRVNDPHIYLTGDRQIATQYAQIGSEVLFDTLSAAFALLHPEVERYSETGRALVAGFARSWRQRHGMRPLVLTVAVPWEQVPVPEGARIRDPREWFEAASRYEPLNTLMIPGPLPVSWVVAAEELAETN